MLIAPTQFYFTMGGNQISFTAAVNDVRCGIQNNTLLFTPNVDTIVCTIEKQELHFTVHNNLLVFTPTVNNVLCTIVENKILFMVESSARTTAWTYIQEASPLGGEGYTWFQPSTGYGHVWIAGLAEWFRFLTENMTADSIDHSIVANGGYY